MFRAEYLIRAGKFNRAIGNSMDVALSGPCDKTTERGINLTGPCDITEGHSPPDKFAGDKKRKKIKKRKIRREEKCAKR